MDIGHRDVTYEQNDGPEKNMLKDIIGENFPEEMCYIADYKHTMSGRKRIEIESTAMRQLKIQD